MQQQLQTQRKMGVVELFVQHRIHRTHTAAATPHQRHLTRRTTHTDPHVVVVNITRIIFIYRPPNQTVSAPPIAVRAATTHRIVAAV
jgi:hypothetical protein